MTSTPVTEYCYCHAQRRYQEVELRLREDRYWLTLTLVTGGQWVVNRIVNTRMTVDDALYRMELVGHDFYLFVDQETVRPSVVYRRKGWDYGVIGLDTQGAAAGAASAAGA